MARGQFDYSEFAPTVRRSKRRDILPALVRLAGDQAAKGRIAKMSALIRRRFDAIGVAEPALDAKTTNPFVLAAHALRHDLSYPTELDKGLAAAKEFSSLETAAGRVVEDIVPPEYGWTKSESESHSPMSEIDCAKMVGDTVKLVALKSGPSCVNDSMVNRIGTAISTHAPAWAKHWNARKLQFTVGMIYSTAKKSNKKDWAAIRLAEEALAGKGARIVESCMRVSGSRVIALPRFVAEHEGLAIEVSTRQGVGLWNYIGEPVADCYVEVGCALTQASVKTPSLTAPTDPIVTEGLAEAVSVPQGFNLPNGSPITPEQLPWLFLFARHFVDELTD